MFLNCSEVRNDVGFFFIISCSRLIFDCLVYDFCLFIVRDVRKNLVYFLDIWVVFMYINRNLNIFWVCLEVICIIEFEYFQVFVYISCCYIFWMFVDIIIDYFRS